MPDTPVAMLALLASILLTAGIAAAQPAPSFDCAKAASEPEQAICKDARLAEADAGIARAYAAALARLKGAAAKALKEDQRSFLAIRDAAYGLPHENLADRLDVRLNFLQRVATAGDAGDFAGTWENSNGLITIAPVDGTKLRVEAQAADAVYARWVCDIADEVAPEKGALTFTDSEIPAEVTTTIRISRDGPLLTLSEEVKADAIRSYCGANGALEGAYFRTAP